MIGSSSTVVHIPRREQLPPEILSGRRWVGWRYEPRPGQSKPAKVPIHTETGQWTNANDPASWRDFEVAAEAVAPFGLNGIGHALVPDDALTWIDLDVCCINGKPDPWAEEVLAVFGDTYAEVTPSGDGYRVIVSGCKPFDGCVAPVESTKKSAKLECYDRGRYMAVTGRRLESHPCQIAKALDRLDWLAHRYPQLAKAGSTPAPVTQGPGIVLADDELLRRALSRPLTGQRLAALLRGDMLDHGSQSEADWEMSRLLVHDCGGDQARVLQLILSHGTPRKKWNQIADLEGRTYLEHTIANAARKVSRVYTGPVVRPAQPNTNKHREEEDCCATSPAEKLISYIRKLRLAHGRPVGLSARQAGELLGVHYGNASRQLKALVEAGRLTRPKTGTHWNGIASHYDLPEFDVKKPASKPAGKKTVPCQPPPFTERNGQAAVWWWSTKLGKWQWAGEGQDAADKEMAKKKWVRWWSVGGERVTRLRAGKLACSWDELNVGRLPQEVAG